MIDTLETKQEGRVLRVWLNRPEKHNALTIGLCGELIQLLDRANHDAGVGSVLLAGKGSSFCAGMDLIELAGDNIDKISRVQEALFTVGVRFTKPLIAAVHGAALAGGTGLVANCHVVIASEDSTFGLTEIRFGLWPFVIFPAVSAAIGERRAIALSITGEIFGATEALRIGLVHRMVPINELEQAALNVAQTVASASSGAMSSGLGFARAGPRSTVEIRRRRLLIQTWLSKNKPALCSIYQEANLAFEVYMNGM
jgi:enoyl-CoA hydratase/carnithine racemase